MSSVREEVGLSGRFRAVFEAELDYVCRVLRRLGVAEVDVPDVAQEVFVTVHRRFADYDPERPVRPWLSAFVTRIAANHRRLARHRRERPAEEAPTPRDPCWSPEESAVREQRKALLLAALDDLPDERREVLVLCDLQGFEASEVAELLGVPRNTVYSRLRTARSELEAAVRRRGMT